MFACVTMEKTSERVYEIEREREREKEGERAKLYHAKLKMWTQILCESHGPSCTETKAMINYCPV